VARLIRTFGQDAPDRSRHDCIEVIDLLRRGAKAGKMRRRFRNAAQVFAELIFEASFDKNVVVQLRGAIVNPFLLAQFRAGWIALPHSLRHNDWNVAQLAFKRREARCRERCIEEWFDTTSSSIHGRKGWLKDFC